MSSSFDNKVIMAVQKHFERRGIPYLFGNNSDVVDVAISQNEDLI